MNAASSPDFASLTFRWAVSRDETQLGAALFDAVRHGPSRYTEKERRAWAPWPRRGPDWRARLSGQMIRVAERGRRIVGFMTLADDYVDFAYVRPEARGAGVFRGLHEAIEAAAIRAGVEELSTHASLNARGPFEAVGFNVIRMETVEQRGERLRRFEMTKRISGRR